MLSEALARFLEQGNSVLIAVRDVNLSPYGARVWAVAVSEDRTEVTAYLHKSAAARILEHVEANPQVSLGFSRPTDHQAYQLKGVFVGSRACGPRDRQVVQRQVDGFLGELGAVGIPRSMMAGWRTSPCAALTIRIREVFAQTPGPGAGRLIQ